MNISESLQIYRNGHCKKSKNTMTLGEIQQTTKACITNMPKDFLVLILFLIVEGYEPEEVIENYILERHLFHAFKKRKDKINCTMPVT